MISRILKVLTELRAASELKVIVFRIYGTAIAQDVTLPTSRWCLRARESYHFLSRCINVQIRSFSLSRHSDVRPAIYTVYRTRRKRRGAVHVIITLVKNVAGK